MNEKTQRATFAHFDMIAASEPGSVLLVCEPIKAWYAGDRFDLEPGLWIRVTHASDHELYGKAVINGKVHDLSIRGQDFTSLEIQKASPVKRGE